MIQYGIYTKIEFDGDVGIGVRADGVIGFQNIEKTEIGTVPKESNNIYPIIFEFKNPKSIDVLIEQLNRAKEIIKERRKENKDE